MYILLVTLGTVTRKASDTNGLRCDRFIVFTWHKPVTTCHKSRVFNGNHIQITFKTQTKSAILLKCAKLVCQANFT